jgi:hypothetical protein
MDIIAAHRQGLLEQLDEGVAALAGRPRDHAQRAIVLHHLHDHSRGNHLWALAEARRSLRLAAGLAALRRRLDRWGWAIAHRDEAGAALDGLAEALGRTARSRTIAIYRAYRATGTQAMRDEADAWLDPVLADLLGQCHAARRIGMSMALEDQQSLAVHCEQLAAAATDPAEIDAAWVAIEATGLRRAARRLLGDKAVARQVAKDQRRGTARVECDLRNDATLPASFRANPAQHFYALQQMLRQRRHQQWREACDLETDAFELAA